MAQPGGLALGLDDVPEPSHEHFETGFVVLLIGEPCECGEVAPSGGRETGMVASTSVASVMRQTRDPRVRPPAGRTVPRSNPPDRPMCPRDAVAAPRSVAGLWPKPHPPSTRNQVRSWEKASSFHYLAPRPLLLRRQVARRRRFLIASWLATTFGMLTRSVGAPLVFTAVLTDAAGMRAGATFGHDLAPRVVAYAGVPVAWALLWRLVDWLQWGAVVRAFASAATARYQHLLGLSHPWHTDRAHLDRIVVVEHGRITEQGSHAEPVGMDTGVS